MFKLLDQTSLLKISSGRWFLNGQCHENFHLRFLHRTTPSGALINYLKNFKFFSKFVELFEFEVLQREVILLTFEFE
jgi:hypothetical protein